MPLSRHPDMIYRSLGSTGETVSAIGLGGWHLALKHVDKKLAETIVHRAIDNGINFLDNSWDYNDGESEIRMGKALKGDRRDQVILMTKIDGRSKQAAQQQLDESLKRMGVDMIDVVQHHEVIRYEDPDRIFDREDGAQSVLEAAKKAGKLRFIGFTGHKDPQVHLRTLDVAEAHGVAFDTVQMPLNVMDAHFRSFEKLVLPRLVDEKIGVLGMKSLANGILLRSNTVTATECLHYALNLPTSVVITGIDSLDVLKQALDAAKTFHPLSEQDVAAMLAKTAEAANTGEFEPFKTTSVFDATAQNPEWLGEEPKRFRELVGQ
ncbi:MAG: aldo/keto reductase [Planctomycetota bacterium]|nr:aldo/keto reductase [Planctomycetota bacterium]